MPKKADYLKEKLALQDLAAQMANHPEEILPRFVDLALEATGAITGGLSLYEENPAPGVFRWHCLRGTLEKFDGATTPRDFSPCGITLDQNGPVLVQNPEGIYTWLVDAGVSLPEVLLVPLKFGSASEVGTLWVVSAEQGNFDSGHVRVLTELAAFCSIALRMIQSEERLRKALTEQELLTREMDHRVQNLFAVVDSLIRSSKKGAADAHEMADSLSGRLHALRRAHGLVRRSLATPDAVSIGSDLATLIRSIIAPYQKSEDEANAQFSLEGSPVQCGEHAVTTIALVFHELTTNSAKYGALKMEEGRIAVRWHDEAESLILRWIESGGPVVDEAPANEGFGTKLVKNTVKQLGGTLLYDWQTTGLILEIRIPFTALAH